MYLIDILFHILMVTFHFILNHTTLLNRFLQNRIQLLYLAHQILRKTIHLFIRLINHLFNIAIILSTNFIKFLLEYIFGDTLPNSIIQIIHPFIICNNVFFIEFEINLTYKLFKRCHQNIIIKL